jgi:hypothetical protein
MRPVPTGQCRSHFQAEVATQVTEAITNLLSGSTSFPGSPSLSDGKEPLPDFFDPKTWPTTDPICRVYGNPSATVEATVDYIDYIWAIQWLWDCTRSKGKKGKLYICRSITIRNGAGRKGRAEDGRINFKQFLHVEIMKRTGILPPSPLHTMVDHRDGNSLNCCRSNLRWATAAMNRANIDGGNGSDLMEG